MGCGKIKRKSILLVYYTLPQYLAGALHQARLGLAQLTLLILYLRWRIYFYHLVGLVTHQDYVITGSTDGDAMEPAIEVRQLGSIGDKLVVAYRR